jgi:hypothetical protein
MTGAGLILLVMVCVPCHIYIDRLQIMGLQISQTIVWFSKVGSKKMPKKKLV